MISLGLIDAVWAGSEFEGPPGIRKAQELGFSSVDLVIDPLDLSDEAHDRLVGEVTDTGVPVVSIPCVSLGIADYNPAVQRFHVERAKRHVDLAAELGAHNVLLVIGEYYWEREIISLDEQWQTAVANVRQVADHATGKSIGIVMELEPFPRAYINSIELMVRFLDDIDSETVKANADLGHLWPLTIAASTLLELAGRIAYAHISDTHGGTYENLPPGRGTAPLRDYLQALVDSGYDGVLSLELEPPPSGVDPVAWVEEGRDRTAELLRTVNPGDR